MNKISNRPAFRGLRRIPGLWTVVAGALFLLLAETAPGQPTGEPMRMQEVLARATAAFQRGDYEESLRLFEVLDTTFGREPELKEPGVQRILLPARGYAEFAVGNYDSAIENFAGFLEKFPDTGDVHAFVLYTLSQAHQLNDQPEEASQRLSEFTSSYPRSPEASLAALQQADLLFRTGETEEALELTNRLYESDFSRTLRTQARLRALQVLVDEKRFGDAFVLIRDTRWRIRTMPELAVLAFAALQTGDHLLSEGKPGDALRCYRLVPPYETLLELQEQQLLRTERIIDYRTRNARSPMASAWNEYYRQLAGRLRVQLQALEEMDDYTPGFILRYGQAFLRSERPWESLVLSETLALDESFPPDLREQAHYQWVLANYALEDWEETFRVADLFGETFPDSELAPETLYLVAQAYQEQRKFRDAVDVYSQLLDLYPDHSLAARWRFTKGFNLAMLEQYEEARSDFEQFMATHPEHLLGTQAALWHALTHHFEGNYDDALAELRPLAERSGGHRLYPEIRYRIATATYGNRDYEEARTLIEDYLEEFPMHQRAAEAVVLRGDILMGLGELIRASNVFAEVTPEAGGLFPYAIFQRGKIFKALERYDLMIDHFREYIDREDLESKPRVGEALYWLGWALLQSGRPEEALAQFDEAIDTSGNDPAATEIQPLLASLETIRRDLLKSEEASDLNHPVTRADSFNDWIDQQIETALEEDRKTWFSRLKYFQALREKARGDEEMAQTILLEIDEEVPLEQLDPEVIGQVGLIFSEMGFDYAEDYFDFILEKYPDHPARAEAWFGLAQLLFQEGELEEAEDLLRKFEDQMPLHPLAVRVRILRGRLLTELGDYEDAENTFEEVLKLKQARGIPHARSLAGLAELNEAKGDLKRAIPYWQRIYTLYRAYPDLVAEAYFRSARLFEEIGDPAAAYRSLEEMLADERLLTTPFGVKATDLRDALLENHGPFPEKEPERNAPEPQPQEAS